jgi:ABC-2 type transport system permease protein
MLYYLRVWWRLVLMSLIREAEYRLNFLLSLGEGMLQLIIAVLTFEILYRFTDEVAGWTQGQMLVLLGIYRLVEGLVNMLIAPNQLTVSQLIRRGDLDFLLLRPIASQFLVSTRIIRPHEGVNALIGLGLVLYASPLAGVQWQFGNLVAAIIFMISGILLLYAIWFLSNTALFWTQARNQDQIIPTLFQAARYPVSFFPRMLRIGLTFVIPAAFATTFPSQALFGQITWPMLFIGIALALGMLLLSAGCWVFALRHYTSASS